MIVKLVHGGAEESYTKLRHDERHPSMRNNFFFLSSDRGGAKKKNLREKIERRKEEKKERKNCYLIYPNFYPTIPERQNVRTCQKDFAILKKLVTITTCRRYVPLIDNRFNLGYLSKSAYSTLYIHTHIINPMLIFVPTLPGPVPSKWSCLETRLQLALTLLLGSRRIVLQDLG